ncbi:hypothetical protein, partial [Kaistella sp.]|uniref:hypothetical protein n=1 Tax=Kaistella sp. TaxID=2782235 RepID=UPI003C345DB3
MYKKANNETEIFHASKALKIPTNECLMLLLNKQAIRAIAIQMAIANSRVEKLSQNSFIECCHCFVVVNCRVSRKVVHNVRPPSVTKPLFYEHTQRGGFCQADSCEMFSPLNTHR